jgi:hypothetical protein
MPDEPIQGGTPAPEPAAPTTPATPAPAFDAAALQTMVNGAIKEALPNVVSEVDKARSMHQPAPQPQPAPSRTDPVADFLAPYIAPGLAAVNLKAEGAADAATFYATHPEALANRDLIEQRFNMTMQAGRPIPRADLYQHWRGGEGFKDAVQAEIDRRTAEAGRARDAAHPGGGSRPHTAGPAKSAIDMTDEELQAVMNTAAF